MIVRLIDKIVYRWIDGILKLLKNAVKSLLIDLLIDIDWYWLILIDIDWYWMILIDIDWYWLILVDIDCYYFILRGDIDWFWLIDW